MHQDERHAAARGGFRNPRIAFQSGYVIDDLGADIECGFRDLQLLRVDGNRNSFPPSEKLSGVTFSTPITRVRSPRSSVWEASFNRNFFRLSILSVGSKCNATVGRIFASVPHTLLFTRMRTGRNACPT